MFSEILAIALYVSILFLIGFLSFKKNQSEKDFLIGGRAMNFWVTALAAHASDMSSWLFLGLPAAIFSTGVFEIWFAMGLVFFMFLNWLFIAPKIRAMTEHYNSMTFSSFFESRFQDTTGSLRIITAIMQLIFFSIYVSAGVVGIGVLMNSLFGLNEFLSRTISLFIVIPYLFFGGYRTLAWIDLFQGLFLLCVIVFVPLYALPLVGGFEGISTAVSLKGLSTTMFPVKGFKGFLGILLTFTMWGLGYFGQPHIVTKFMGIKSVKEIKKSMTVGMSWQILTLAAAVLIGLIAVPFFQGQNIMGQDTFPTLVTTLFIPFFAALILCALLAATISTMDSQILVVATSLSEDFYKRILRKEASSKEMVLVSRIAIVLITLISFGVAAITDQTIYDLVYYAWAGLGTTFGPVLIFALYSKRANRYGAWAGIVVGGLFSLIWPTVESHFSLKLPLRLSGGFVLSCVTIWLISHITRKKVVESKTYE